MRKGCALNPEIIKKYDIRGILGKNFVMSDVLAIAKTLGSMAVRSHGQAVVVARDTRSSSNRIEDELVRGLISCGVYVLRLGVMPTPLVTFATRVLGASMGISVTGSQHSGQYNGFKIMWPNRPFYGADFKDMSLLCAKQNWVSSSGKVLDVDIKKAYIARVLVGYTYKSKIKIAWNFLNGATCALSVELLQKVSGEHYVINNIAKSYGVNDKPDPFLAQHHEALLNVLLTHACDVGIIFDGGGECMVVMGGDGVVVASEDVLLFLAYFVLQGHPGATIVGDNQFSSRFFERIHVWGGKLLVVASGEGSLKEAMQRKEGLLGGDLDGRICFADAYDGIADAMYAAVRFIYYLTGVGMNISTWIERMLPRVALLPDIRMVYDTGQDKDMIDMICVYLAQRGRSFDKGDHMLYVRAHDGWWILRAVNMENCFILSGGSYSPDNLGRLQEDIDAALYALGPSVRTF